jgi:hypothetical protein
VPIAGYGLVLIVVMLVFPAGIQGGIRRLLGLAGPTATGQVTAIGRRWHLASNPAGRGSAAGNSAANSGGHQEAGDHIAAGEAAAKDGVIEEGTP